MATLNLIVTLLYNGLKIIGLWDKLLEHHNAREAANVENEVSSLSDSDLDRRVQLDITRK